MSTPYDLVPKTGESLGIRGESLDPKRFAAVDPWETRVCKAEKLQLGARGKSKNGLRSAMKSEYRRQDETLLDKALRLMHRTVQAVFKEERLLAACIQFQESGLINFARTLSIGKTVSLYCTPLSKSACLSLSRVSSGRPCPRLPAAESTRTSCFSPGRGRFLTRRVPIPCRPICSCRQAQGSSANAQTHHEGRANPNSEE